MDDWLPVQGFPKYSVNRQGQVRHDRKDHVLYPQVTQRGVAYVVLQRETTHFSRGLALLVAKAFLPEPPRNFDTPINLDGDRFNCAVSNLAWRPRWFAQQYHRQFRERTHPLTVPVRDLDTGRIFRDGMCACVEHGLLEKDLHLSILNHTVAWPLMHRFDLD